ncbi:hypothetical protein GCK32_009773 [Trichostrongylus colubriformis]|uniref:Uncharacterized protein n=1 Tax=Trichostrongylus colubriformis TaxID=6319 RepID=A0AAN8GF77_TRICO
MNVNRSKSFTCFALRQSNQNIEIVPQEACIQHKGPETMLQERQAREAMTRSTATDSRRTNELRTSSSNHDQKRLSVF